MKTRSAYVLGVFAVILAGCTEDATQIIVAVGTDIPVPAELGLVRVARCVAGTLPPELVTAGCAVHDFDLRSQTVPFSLTLGAKEDDLDERIAVMVLGYRAAPMSIDDVIASRTTDAQFRPNQTLGLAITLVRDCPPICMGAMGDPACCGDIPLVPVRPGQELDLLDGGMRPPPMDAGDRCGSNDDCDDDNPCTDDHCEEGVCGEPTPVVCDDEDDNDCTDETCDEETGECVPANAPDDRECGSDDGVCCMGVCTDTDSAADHCGACDTACDTNETCATGRCECGGAFEQCDAACVSLTTPKNCGACGNACTGPTPACLGSACGACAEADDCPSNDGRGCTTTSATCVDGACVYELEPDTCLIDDECRASGERNPENDCEECAPTSAADAWSDRDGETCDDGLFCTTGTTCDRATCGGSTPLICDDTLACTNDSCDESADECVNDVRTGCAIEGVCYAARARNPANQCEECDPASPTGWSAVIVGGACDDGALCTIDDECQPDGSCDGDPNPCNDSVACTDDSCNTVTDVCVNAIQPNKCNVSGTCYDTGLGASGNTCATCDPARSTTALSPVPQETGCMPGAMGGGHCCGGVCQPINSAMHCFTCGNVCDPGEVCGVFSMMPPDFRCCTTCPPP